MELIQRFFTDTIYGLFILCLPIYGIAWLARRTFKSAPNPPLVAVITFGLLAMTLPSIPRYQFEAQGLKMVQEHPEYKLAWTARYGDFLEPLTLINAPIGFFKLVSPDPLSYRRGEDGAFHTVILRYKEDRRELIVHAGCSDKTMLLSEPDNSGVFRYRTEKATEMSKEDIEIYCLTDYSEQVQAVRDKILSKGK